MQLVIEMTYTDVKVDVHTYVKMFTSLYFDFEIKIHKKDFLNYAFTLFGADHPYEVYEYGTDLF